MNTHKLRRKDIPMQPDLKETMRNFSAARRRNARETCLKNCLAMRDYNMHVQMADAHDALMAETPETAAKRDGFPSVLAYGLVRIHRCPIHSARDAKIVAGVMAAIRGLRTHGLSLSRSCVKPVRSSKRHEHGIRLRQRVSTMRKYIKTLKKSRRVADIPTRVTQNTPARPRSSIVRDKCVECPASLGEHGIVDPRTADLLCGKCGTVNDTQMPAAHGVEYVDYTQYVYPREARRSDEPFESTGVMSGCGNQGDSALGPLQHGTSKPMAYRRTSYFRDLANKITNQKSTPIASSVMAAVLSEVRGIHGGSAENVLANASVDDVLCALETCGLSAMYSQAARILKDLTGRDMAVTVTAADIDTLVDLFTQFDDVWDDIKPIGRASAPSYKYVLIQLMRVAGMDVQADYFTTCTYMHLKSTRKSADLDIMWNMACERLHWPFIGMCYRTLPGAVAEDTRIADVPMDAPASDSDATTSGSEDDGNEWE